MKKIQTLLSGLAFLVTAAVVTAHAEEAAAETNAGLAKLLDFRVAIVKMSMTFASSPPVPL
jgi:hypothetical protein